MRSRAFILQKLCNLILGEAKEENIRVLAIYLKEIDAESSIGEGKIDGERVEISEAELNVIVAMMGL